MARISCNKLWKMLIDQERKKPAFALLPLQNLAKRTTLPQVFYFVSAR